MLNLPFCRTKLAVRISDCVHYAGFYYGGGTHNPYEDYLQTLNKSGYSAARLQFIDFLKYYRPQNFFRALGYKDDGNVPLWCFPWVRNGKNVLKKKNFGWHLGLLEVPDIITHFHEQGIMAYRITEEFAWLERAYYSISAAGYNPDQHSYCTAWELIDDQGRKKYLLTDGNHRVSALSTLGKETVTVEVHRTIKLSDINSWYLVKKGLMSAADAKKIFLAYFANQNAYANSSTPAKILNHLGQEAELKIFGI
jgi:hypothetical protein